MTDYKIDKKTLFGISKKLDEQEQEKHKTIRKLNSELHHEQITLQASELKNNLIDFKKILDEHENKFGKTFKIHKLGYNKRTRYRNWYTSSDCNLLWGRFNNFGITEGNKAVLSENEKRDIVIVVESDDKANICLISNPDKYLDWIVKENIGEYDEKHTIKYIELSEFKNCQPFDKVLKAYAQKKFDKKKINVKFGKNQLSIDDFEDSLIQRCSVTLRDFSKKIDDDANVLRNSLSSIEGSIIELEKNIKEFKSKR